MSDWIQVFGEERLTAALLDRLTHKPHILEFTEESYGFRHRMQREAEESDPYDRVGNLSIVNWSAFRLTQAHA